MITLQDCVERAFFEDNRKHYIVEIDEKKLFEWLVQEQLDLLDYPISIEKKILLYNDIEEELGKNLTYETFTVKLV